MAEPAEKRLRSSLPRCTEHQSSSRASRSLQAPVEEALCAVSSMLRGGGYRLQALKPLCEGVSSLLPALELLRLQLKEELSALLELSLLARSLGDPNTASLVKGHFLSPRVHRLKVLGDLMTSARRVGCTNEGTGGLGEFIFNELQEELSR
ncbi:ferritin light chain, oocyte isoform-like [Eleginops maclovinus]|uniref:ferritin light chain, oocyte isoform-like n=1 Tax=Eleginops maclovinus TaxID=56733 RepID=UPI00308022B5